LVNFFREPIYFTSSIRIWFAWKLVAVLNIEHIWDEDLAVQYALLHYVLEDTTSTYEELEAEFGKAVLEGISALSKDKSLEKSKQMEDSLRRPIPYPLGHRDI